MRDQMRQDEHERTFNLSGSEPQDKMVSLDHILFQIEQWHMKYEWSEREHLIFESLKEYLKEQNSD